MPDDPHAIYDLEPIGVAGAMEAVGVHFYCCKRHAAHDVGYSGEGFSEPEAIGAGCYLRGTVCEWCAVDLPSSD